MPKPLTVHPSHAVLLAAVLVLGSLGLLRTDWLQQLDWTVYDQLLARQGRPAPDEVLIVAIDEASLQQLGRWPWSRRVHARLIDRLTEAGARAVMLDIPLSGPDRRDPAADHRLAEAIADNSKVVLAVSPGKAAGNRHPIEAVPLPMLTNRAAAIGHGDIAIDDDGRCRRAYLNASLDRSRWPALALATYSVGEAPDRHLRGSHQRLDRIDRWTRQRSILIPYLGREGHFRRLSYADVLNGRVDPRQLRDRYVLIGTTAARLGNAVSTPMAEAYSRMPEVELHANLLAGLLRHHQLNEMSVWLRNLLTVLLVGVPLTVLIARGNRRVLLILGGAELLTLLVATVLLYGPGLWFPPGAALTTLALAFVLMNGLRLRRSVQEAAKSTRHNWRVTKLDGLTRLPSRERLHESLQDALPQVIDNGRMLGLLVLNLKRFTAVNQRLGVAAADQVLAEAARRIRKVVRQDDLMVRLGGDEFAIMMAGLDNRRPLQELAKRIKRTLRQPFDIEPEPSTLSAHFGAVLFPADGRDGDALLRNAIASMNHAREQGLQGVAFFAERLRVDPVIRAELEQALQGALDRGEFQVRYQPQISAQGGRVIAIESLLRWHSPRFGDVRPAHFLPVAERTGLIIPIGQWALEQACRQAQQWETNGLPGLRMAVNLSTAQFARADLVDTIGQTLERTGMEAERLSLELTEEALIKNLDASQKTLSSLREIGVQISVDDFGTGYSSLSYLTRFPLDRIKIDRSLITELEPGNQAADMAVAIISMAHELKLSVVAKGVETEPQQTYLLDHECDELQGDLYATALPANELEKLLRHGFHLVPRSLAAPLPTPEFAG